MAPPSLPADGSIRDKSSPAFHWALRLECECKISLAGSVCTSIYYHKWTFSVSVLTTFIAACQNMKLQHVLLSYEFFTAGNNCILTYTRDFQKCKTKWNIDRRNRNYEKRLRLCDVRGKILIFSYVFKWRNNKHIGNRFEPSRSTVTISAHYL